MTTQAQHRRMENGLGRPSGVPRIRFLEAAVSSLRLSQHRSGLDGALERGLALGYALAGLVGRDDAKEITDLIQQGHTQEALDRLEALGVEA